MKTLFLATVTLLSTLVAYAQSDCSKHTQLYYNGSKGPVKSIVLTRQPVVQVGDTFINMSMTTSTTTTYYSRQGDKTYRLSEYYDNRKGEETVRMLYALNDTNKLLGYIPDSIDEVMTEVWKGNELHETNYKRKRTKWNIAFTTTSFYDNDCVPVKESMVFYSDGKAYNTYNDDMKPEYRAMYKKYRVQAYLYLPGVTITKKDKYDNVLEAIDRSQEEIKMITLKYEYYE